MGLTAVFGMGTGVSPPLWPSALIVTDKRYIYFALRCEEDVKQTLNVAFAYSLVHPH